MKGKTDNPPLESSPLDELEAQGRFRKVLELLLEVDLERMSALLEGRKLKDKGLYNGV